VDDVELERGGYAVQLRREHAEPVAGVEGDLHRAEPVYVAVVGLLPPRRRGREDLHLVPEALELPVEQGDRLDHTVHRRKVCVGEDPDPHVE
jgi:hypothetical protein